MVSVFKRSAEKERSAAAQGAARRATRLATPDLADWADVLISEAGKNLTDWRRARGDGSIHEFIMTVDALTAISDEMKKRYSDGSA